MNWFQKNFKTIIYTSFLVPIITVAIVSISHVTKWYGISNPVSWAIYLSIGVEIAALSALAAISARMGKKVYIPFGIVTLIQFIGNIFFAYQYIDINSQNFKDWVDMVDPLVSFLGVESGNMIGHKRFLALFAGGMLPLISLSFLHMLVKFEEDEKSKEVELKPIVDIDDLSIKAGKIESQLIKEEEKEKYSPTEEEIERLEKLLKNYNVPVEEINQTKPYSPTEDELLKIEEHLNKLQEEKLDNVEPNITIQNEPEIMVKTNEDVIDEPTENQESNIKRLTYLRRDAQHNKE
jgi:hypothetical protein